MEPHSDGFLRDKPDIEMLVDKRSHVGPDIPIPDVEANANAKHFGASSPGPAQMPGQDALKHQEPLKSEERRSQQRDSSNREAAGENDARKPPSQPEPVTNRESNESMSIPRRNTNANAGERKAKRKLRDGQSNGRWTEGEHQAFLKGMQKHGREWKKVAIDIPTRTSAQVRSHAQKYFAKIQKQQEEYFIMELATHAPNNEQQHASDSFRQSVARIVQEPESVQQEVEQTLHRLREKYRHLQEKLQDQRRKRAEDDSTLSSNLQDDEMIALSVLHGGLSAEEDDNNDESLADDQKEASS